jgi:hypothetical protein
MSMDERPITITGGAGPMEAAAIAAIVQYVLDSEDAARSRPPARSVPSPWVRLGAPTPLARFNPPVTPAR